MKFISQALLAGVLLLASAPNLPALTVIPPSFEELVQKADAVLQTEVVSTKAQWTGEGKDRHIVTKVRLRVVECIVGEAPSETELTFFGGEVAGEGMIIDGVPCFGVGDKDLLFVQGNGKVFCPLVHVGHGRYPIVLSSVTGKSLIARSDGTPLRQTADVARALEDSASPASKLDEGTSMSLEDFKTAVVRTALAQGKRAGRQAK